MELITRRRVYDGFARIDLLTLRHRLHDGGWSDVMERELYDRGHVAAVLPYDPHSDRIVLIRQFRVGAYAAGFPAWQVEIVAGMIDPGETPVAVAIREMREETALTVRDLEPVTHYLPSAGASNETVSLFCGRIDAANAGGIHGHDEHEDIEVRTYAVDEIPALLADRAAANAMTIIALQWFWMNRDALRRRWLAETPT